MSWPSTRPRTVRRQKRSWRTWSSWGRPPPGRGPTRSLGEPARFGARSFLIYASPVAGGGAIVVASDAALLLRSVAWPQLSAARLFVTDPSGVVWSGCETSAGCRVADREVVPSLREAAAGPPRGLDAGQAERLGLFRCLRDLRVREGGRRPATGSSPGSPPRKPSSKRGQSALSRIVTTGRRRRDRRGGGGDGRSSPATAGRRAGESAPLRPGPGQGPGSREPADPRRSTDHRGRDGDRDRPRGRDAAGRRSRESRADRSRVSRTGRSARTWRSSSDRSTRSRRRSGSSSTFRGARRSTSGRWGST